MKAKSLTFKPLADGTAEVVLLTSDRAAYQHLAMLQASEKPLNVEIKQWREKRSLSANSALWLLLGRIANKIESHPDEVYLEMLQRYSHKFTHIIAKPEAVEEIKQQWRTVIDMGPLSVNDTEAVQLRCYFGSSTMDSKQFSTLLSGVISECEELGLQTLRDGQFDAIIAQYEREVK